MTLFVAHGNSGEFCNPGCKARHADIKPTRLFETTREALAAGFRPCKKCKPLKTGLSDPEWIETLMARVESDPAKRWHDYELEAMELDPATVRRWFIANHGFTFHGYTRLRRLGQALRQIQHGEPVTQAVIAQGYDSESGFRESFTSVFGDPPSAVERHQLLSWRYPLQATLTGPRAARSGMVLQVH